MQASTAKENGETYSSCDDYKLKPGVISKHVEEQKFLHKEATLFCSYSSCYFLLFSPSTIQ